MSRYIDVDKFIEDQRKFYCEDCYMRKSTSTGKIVYDIDSSACGSCRLNDALNALEDAPTADVEEVVRCKNCKYCEKIDDHEWWCCGTGFPAILTAPEDYCSKGAKMDGGKE